ncbi:hypothetical protein G6F57_020942 [Rhizopus arrhizus]|nr:hypothetical protein G6F57_020942 [Rhizopus arrhizus]
MVLPSGSVVHDVASCATGWPAAARSTSDSMILLVDVQHAAMTGGCGLSQQRRGKRHRSGQRSGGQEEFTAGSTHRKGLYGSAWKKLRFIGLRYEPGEMPISHLLMRPSGLVWPMLRAAGITHRTRWSLE